jgi:hypothetical protein
MILISSIVILGVLSQSGCGSPDGSVIHGSVPKKSEIDKRSSRYGKLDKALQDYFVAYGIPGGLDGWRERFALFSRHIDAEENTAKKVSYENLLGRVMQDLSIRNIARKVGYGSSSMFSLYVQKFMGVLRAFQYLDAISKDTSFPNKEEFMREYEMQIKTLVEFVIIEKGSLTPGQRYSEYGNTVGLMVKIFGDYLQKTSPNSTDPLAINEQALRHATRIYELDQLKEVPYAVLRTKMGVNAFKSLSNLLMHCSHNSSDILPGLEEALVDKCYSGLILYERALAQLLETGDIGEKSASRADFHELLKTIADIVVEATRAAERGLKN